MSSVAGLLLSRPLRACLPRAPRGVRARSFVAQATTAAGTMSSEGGERTTFGQDAVPCYVFGTKGAPGVVMLQEWWGVNAQVRAGARARVRRAVRSPLPLAPSASAATRAQLHPCLAVYSPCAARQRAR